MVKVGIFVLPNLRGNAFDLSSSSALLATGILQMLFTKMNKFPFMFSLLRVFTVSDVKVCQILILQKLI